MTLVEMMENSAGKFPEKDPIVFRSAGTAYSELYGAVNRFANGMIACFHRAGGISGV